MLQKFSVQYFKCFDKKIELDLTKIRDYEFNKSCVQKNIVSKALIYGPNSAGKSNLGLAIFDIIYNLTDKQKSDTFYKNYINAQENSDYAEFSYSFKFNNSVISYSYRKKNIDNIIYEKVSIDDEVIILCDRTKKKPEVFVNILGAETLNKDISKIDISFVKYVKSNSILKKSKQNDILSKFFKFVDSMLMFWSLGENRYLGYKNGIENIFKYIIENNLFDNFIKFLSSVSLPSNITYKKIDNDYNIFYKFKNKEIEFFSSASAGMKSLALFYYWIQYVKNEKEKPSFIFIDEFDAFYHSKLSQMLVKEITKIEDCQILLTTHDTSIMTNDFLRPDCLFIMNNGIIKNIADSTSKELRFAHNIEKMYRARAFYNE